MSDRPQVQKTARGHRPQYFNDPMTDKLLTMTLAMAEELWVVRERLDTVEALAEKSGAFTEADIEAFQPDDARAANREALRQEFLDRLFYSLKETVEDTVRGDTEEAYSAVVAASAAAD